MYPESSPGSTPTKAAILTIIYGLFLTGPLLPHLPQHSSQSTPLQTYVTPLLKTVEQLPDGETILRPDVI